MDKIIVAVIVSMQERHCYRFLHHYKLNPNCFKVMTRQEQLMGIDRKTPIIVIHSDDRLDSYNEMLDFIKDRFVSVRYMDY